MSTRTRTRTRYWVVSLPVHSSPPSSSSSSLWSRLQEQISKHSFDTPLYRMRQRFLWDKARYPTMSPLKEIVDGIHVQVAKIEDDLKPTDIITTEHLVTLLAVVPKYSQKDWLSSYETITTCVVPRSSKKLLEDNEYALYTVTLFSRDADNFRTKARERGFQIRDFEYNSETQETRKQEIEKLMQDQDALRTTLLQWCYTSYGEVFSSWMHFCAVRVFSESILRYGLPPSFLSVVMAPTVKSEKKVRSILEGLCNSSNSTFWKSDDEGSMGGFGGDADAYPYVSFTINLI